MLRILLKVVRPEGGGCFLVILWGVYEKDPCLTQSQIESHELQD